MTPNDSLLTRATVPLSVLLDEAKFEAALLSPARDTITPDQLRAIRAAPVAASMVIELADPSPYVMPDDLLLITGLGLPNDPAEVRAYIERVRGAGVTALVFGTEPVFTEVPSELIEACRALDFPLIALPPQVYFAPVTLHLNRALDVERTQTLATVNALAHRLTEASLQHRPAQRIVEVLTQQRDTWAALSFADELYSAGTGPSHEATEELLAGLRARLAGQRATRGVLPTAFATVSIDGELREVTAHEISPARLRTRASEPPAILLLARAPRLTSSDRTALLLAANLVGLIVQLPAEQSMAVDQLLMHVMIEAAPNRRTEGERDRFSRLLASSLGGCRAAYAVTAMRDPRQPTTQDPLRPATTVASDAAWLRRLLHTPFVEHRADRLRAFVGHPPTAAEFAQAAGLGWLLAVSSAHAFVELPEAMLEAEELARVAIHLGQHVDGTDPATADDWPLSAATDPVIARTAATRWLTPLEGPELGEARAALASWLRNHGSWDQTARALDVHRNTVRRLVSVAAAALGRDLSDPLERARILLAFEAVDPVRE